MVDPWAGKAVYTLGPWRGPKGDPATALDEVRNHLGGAIAWSYRDVWEPGSTRPPRLDAYLAWRPWMRSFGRDYGAAIAACQRALSLDPRFIWPRVSLFHAYLQNSQREAALAQLTRLEADYSSFTAVERGQVHLLRANIEGRTLEVLKAFEELTAVHPETYYLRYNHALAEIALNRTGSAIRRLTGIPPEWAGKGNNWEWWPASTLGWAYHQRGDCASQLRVARESKAIFPDVLDFRSQEVAALAALGRLAEIDPVLDAVAGIRSRPGRDAGDPRDVLFKTVMELRAHGHLEASRGKAERLLAEYRSLPAEAQKEERSTIASLLTLLDRGPEALEIRRALAAEAPSDAYPQVDLAILLAHLGRAEEAREVETRQAAAGDPNHLGRLTFRRAGIPARLGEKERAVALLRQAFAEGFGYREHIHTRMDLESLRGFPPYEDLMKPKD